MDWHNLLLVFVIVVLVKLEQAYSAGLKVFVNFYDQPFIDITL